MEQVCTLTGPVVVGKYYLVPTVRSEWIAGREQDWPVIGPKHNDRQDLDFPWMHYHIDVRFISKRFFYDGIWQHPEKKIVARPISEHNRVTISDVRLRRWKAKRVGTAFCSDGAFTADADTPEFRAHHARWQDSQAQHDGNGWVCPHRNVPLASQPVSNGVVICPLHNLHICNATGRVLSRAEMLQHHGLTETEAEIVEEGPF